jgi:hypothetical protein
MQKAILVLILTVSVALAGQRKFDIAFSFEGNGSTQHMIVEAPDAETAQQIFKNLCTGCKYSSYTEIR